MRIRLRIAVLVALVPVVGTVRAEPLDLAAQPVQLHAEDSRVTTIGALRYLGGLQLRSSNPAFGGLSGVDISADGRTIRFVSDTGTWVQAGLRYDSAGRLTDVGTAEIGRLLSPAGKPIVRKADGDAEDLTSYDGGFAVSFEHDHRIWLYRGGASPFLSRPSALAHPRDASAAPPNKGMEALAAMPDGRLVVIAEDFSQGASFTYGWIGRNGTWQRFDYERTGLFQPTGATALPGGDLLVLERRFTYVGGVAARLARVPASMLQGGALVKGRELARIEPPLTVDNFEGIAARRDAAGRTLVYLVSDDNFNFVQRTLLLLFALEGDPTAADPR